MIETTATEFAHEVELNRTFNAPVALVWEAWSHPEYFSRWFPPCEFTMTIDHMDFRVGGTFAGAFHGMGMVHPLNGTYREIVPNERLEWFGRMDEDSQFEDQVTTTVTFTARGDKTDLHVVQKYRDLTPKNDPRIQGAPIGWGQTLDNLGEFLAEPSTNA